MKRLQRWPIFKVLYSPVVVVVLAIIVLLLARSVWGVYKKEAQAYESSKAALYKLRIMQERRDTLARDVESLQDEEGMEAALREKFSVAKEGEEVIVIGQEDTLKAEATSTPKDTGFWSSFKNFFGE